MNATWDFNWAGSISTTLDCNIFPFPFLYLLHRKVVKIALDYAWKTNTKDKQFFDTNLLVYIYIYTHFLILWNEIFVIVKKLEVILWERRFPKFIENLYIYKKRMDLVFQVHTKWLVNVLDIDYDGILLLICFRYRKVVNLWSMLLWSHVVWWEQTSGRSLVQTPTVMYTCDAASLICLSTNSKNMLRESHVSWDITTPAFNPQVESI